MDRFFSAALYVFVALLFVAALLYCFFGKEVKLKGENTSSHNSLYYPHIGKPFMVYYYCPVELYQTGVEKRWSEPFLSMELLREVTLYRGIDCYVVKSYYYY